MTKAYRILAHTVLALVVLQGALIALGMFGVGAYLEANGSATEESSSPAIDAGFGGHALGGYYVIPAVGLALVIVGHLLRTKLAINWAWSVFALIGVQIVLAEVAHAASPWVGALHGINAFALMTVAFLASRKGVAPDGAEPSVT